MIVPKTTFDDAVTARPLGVGIGSLGEKTLHAVLKKLYEPDVTKHEVKLGGRIADIVNENGIIEIQTRSFDRLRSKLPFFLEHNTVTVVYPIAKTKYVSWIDNETYEISNSRKSPKAGHPLHIMPELYKIKHLLTHPSLRFCIVMLNIDEYRNLDGYGKDKKHFSTRFEFFPTALCEQYCIDAPEDYFLLLPEGLPDPFTSTDITKLAKVRSRIASLTVNILRHVGTIESVGKKGNAILYSKK